VEVLALMRQYFQKQLKEAQGLLTEMDKSLASSGQ
jgi:hypothetical protein